MSDFTQSHSEWHERQMAQDRIDQQLIELMTHDDKWGIKNESLNVERGKTPVEKRVREKRRDPVRVM